MATRKPRVAINGFGRIGRAVFRILSKRDDVEVVALNDITSNEALAYLLRFDTVYGPFEGKVTLHDDRMSAGTQDVLMLEEKEPAKLPWKKLDVDVVVEATGRFRKREQIAQHLEGGARRVILTVPAKDEIDATVVIGVNDQDLGPAHRIISNASCTTNCLAPVAKVLEERFGIVKGYITTVHAYTNDQRLADVPHTEMRRSRAAAENIIPTTTWSPQAVEQVLPELKGRLDGMALNVPVTMLMSMVVAFTITPWMAYHVLKRKYSNAEQPSPPAPTTPWCPPTKRRSVPGEGRRAISRP